jgi:excinuclease ABC subunit C
MESELHSKAENFPTSPGVYLMKNSQGEILYVGKAKNLRARVLCYFTAEKDGRYQVQFLMRKAADIEFIVTSNEKEAVLLENTLIKRHLPRYNIFLKDDKSYLSIKLNLKHSFPRLIPTRRIEKDGSLYFGPYTSAFKAREVVDFIEEHFHLRNCSEHDFANRVRPCLQYQIKRCDAPCVDLISPEAYGEIVQQVRLFLGGRSRELLDLVKEKMEQASAELHFEEAARMRDLLHAIQATLEKQKMVSHFGADSDTVGFHREGDRVSVVILISREGVLGERKNYLFHSHEDSQELMESFLIQYYTAESLIPREILLPMDLEGGKGIAEILSERKGQKVTLTIPEKGEKRSRVDLACQNAKERLLREAVSQEGREEILTRLQNQLQLARLPRRIECYDISNIQGQIAVGSCVCFVDGQPEKKAYRHFKIKTVSQANDFAMLYEVLTRRFSREDWPVPDLIVIDGGKGQLGAAHAALKDKGVLNVDLISLAKEKILLSQNEKRASVDFAAKKPERIFLLGRKNPLILRPNSSELHLLMFLRDEAHRFGIAFHRKLRSKQALQSPLDGIEGVGPTRKRKLLRHFGSLKRLSEASMDEIIHVPGMSRGIAEKVYQAFHERISLVSP